MKGYSKLISLNKMGITACLRNLEQKVFISKDQNLCYELGLFDFDKNPYPPPLKYFVTLSALKLLKNVSTRWLQRRLYGTYTACFFIFMISCNCKLVSILDISLNRPLKDYITDPSLILYKTEDSIKSGNRHILGGSSRLHSLILCG